MSNQSTTLEYWRNQFENVKGDIFDVIKHALLVAVADCPNEFKLKRADIAEFVLTCHLTRCSGCDGIAEMPPPKEAAKGFSTGAPEDAEGKPSKGASSTNTESDDMIHVKGSNLSNNEVEVLTDLLDQQSQTVGEVFRIKDILLNSIDQSSSALQESLTRLELMDVGVPTLMSTNIGVAVNALRKHPIKEISKLARSLVRSWKAKADEWAAVTRAAKDSKDSPDSVNPSGIEEEVCGLLSPPLDDGAFFAPEANSMELSKFFDDIDDFENIGGGHIGDEDKKVTTIRNENKNVEKRKPQFPRERNVLPKDNNSHPVSKQGAVVGQTNPINRDSVVTNPSKLSLQQKENQEMKLHQRVDANSVQRTPVSSRLSEEPFDKKLELAKRKLHERYQQAETAKRQRTVQVMDIHDLPKQGFGSKTSNSKNTHGRPGSRTNGRR